MISTRFAHLAALLALAASISCFAIADTARPLLVTVDDLPLSSRIHIDEEEERVRITRALLDALDAHHIKAVGLVTWKNVRDETDRRLLEMWLDAGHELGNHTARHSDLHELSAAEYVEDAEQGRVFLEKLLAPRGLAPRFFRFTYLHEGDTLEKVQALRAYLRESGQRPLPATIHTRDWSFETAYLDARRASERQEILDEYQDSLRASVRQLTALGERLAGAEGLPQILLLHANAVGAAGWEALFSWAEAQGFRFATADEVLAHPALADLEPRPTTRSFGHWERLADARRRDRAEREVHALIAEQARAWSRGDIDAFMEGYAEDVVFVSPTGLTRGRDEVLARYRKRYPDGQAMGHLALDILETRLAAGYEATREGDATPSRVHGVSVVARWTLRYPDDPTRSDVTGLTLLVLHPTPQGWRIVQDASM